VPHLQRIEDVPLDVDPERLARDRLDQSAQDLTCVVRCRERGLASACELPPEWLLTPRVVSTDDCKCRRS
jgi:hypothetical protein